MAQMFPDSPSPSVTHLCRDSKRNESGINMLLWNDGQIARRFVYLVVN